MLLWKELINESLESDYSQTASREELTLLQIYLCRLFLSPAYQNKPCLLNSDEPFSFLGIKPASESGGRLHQVTFTDQVLTVKLYQLVQPQWTTPAAVRQLLIIQVP
jgi:hypothetical protein